MRGGQLARCLTTKTRIDAETETLIPTIGGVFSYAIQAGALRINPNSGPDGVGVQADIAYTLEARAEVQATAYSVALRGREGGATAELGGEVAGTLRASGGGGDKAHVLAPVVVHGTQDPCTSDIAFALGRNSGQENAVCITGDITHTLKAEGFDASEDGTGRGQPIVAAMRESGPGFWMEDDIAGTLRAEGENRPSRPSNVIAQAFQCSQSGVTLGDASGTLRASTGGGVHDNGALIGMAVRRLTPRECERLQGFPDDYTLIPIRRGMAADGPRYKALGNSWAVPNVAWLGRRIAAELAKSRIIGRAA